MKYFWNTNAPVSFSEVEKYCNTELHYGWAQPTLHTYLTRLVKKGILHSEGKGYKCKRSYYPELTEQELAHKYATDFVDNTSTVEKELNKEADNILNIYIETWLKYNYQKW